MSQSKITLPSTGGKELLSQINLAAQPSAEEQQELEESICDLLQQFTHSDALNKGCQELIEHYGFSNFKNAFDNLLIKDAKISQKYPIEALRGMNAYITDQMVIAITQITLEGAKLHADTYAREFSNPPPTNEFTPKEEERALKKIQELLTEKAAAKIKGINEQSMSSKQKKIAIAQVQHELKQQLDTLDINSPLIHSYCQKKQIQDNLDQKMQACSKQTADKVNMVSFYLRKDILAKESIDARTLAFERTLHVLEKLINTGKLDAASAVWGAIESSDIYHLKATKEGLSSHAQDILSQIKSGAWHGLLHSRYDPINIPRYIQAKNSFAPINHTYSMLLNGAQEGPQINDQGQLSLNKSFIEAERNCLRIRRTTFPSEPNPVLTKEIQRESLVGKENTEKQLNNQLYAICQSYEPRGGAPLPAKSSVMKRVAPIMEPPLPEQKKNTEETCKSLKSTLQNDKKDFEQANLKSNEENQEGFNP